MDRPECPANYHQPHPQESYFWRAEEGEEKESPPMAPHVTSPGIRDDHARGSLGVPQVEEGEDGGEVVGGVEVDGRHGGEGGTFVLAQLVKPRGDGIKGPEDRRQGGGRLHNLGDPRHTIQKGGYEEPHGGKLRPQLVAGLITGGQHVPHAWRHIHGHSDNLCG